MQWLEILLMFMSYFCTWLIYGDGLGDEFMLIGGHAMPAFIVSIPISLLIRMV